MTATTRTSRTRRMLVPVATLLAAASIAIASGATFSSTSANAASVATSGTLTQSNSNANATIFTGAGNIKPGDTVVGTVTITNTGTLGARFTLNEVDATNGFQTPSNLQLVVTDTTDGSEVFSGTFGTMPAGGIALGEFADGEARTYRYEVTLAEGATNVEQGRTARAEYRWDAVQTDGEIIGG
ncbi:hypothetical protein FTX61_03575 [Nitriliruptoraceae bacterium ZYF776]|nr:hypothetical protein [Profundirhabdus halotolerans]